MCGCAKMTGRSMWKVHPPSPTRLIQSRNRDIEVQTAPDGFGGLISQCLFHKDFCTHVPQESRFAHGSLGPGLGCGGVRAVRGVKQVYKVYMYTVYKLYKCTHEEKICEASAAAAREEHTAPAAAHHPKSGFPGCFRLEQDSNTEPSRAEKEYRMRPLNDLEMMLSCLSSI